MKEKIDERLKAVASLVPARARVADVGSDHAYLAMYLFTEGRAEYVVASDKNEGPCAAARATLEAAGLSEKIPVRCGDGLSALFVGEVDYVCIAGMGGELITYILQASPDVFGKLKRVALQPMNDAPLLRKWLYEHGWHIADETMAKVEGRIYEIIAAEQGKETMPSAGILEIGPVLWEKRPQLLKEHVEELSRKYKRILEGLKKSQHPDVVRMKRTEERIHELEAIQW